ncbi:putative reverse transcriptase domain-containing protein [Tanacetum coccineum]
MSQEAWGRSMDASDLARIEVMSLRTTVLGQHAGLAKGPAQPDAQGEAGSSSAHETSQVFYTAISIQLLKHRGNTSKTVGHDDATVKGTELTSYTQRFQELALLCGKMFPEESDKIEKYVGGLPDMIHGSVVASKPKTMQEAVEITTELMDKKIRTFSERQIESNEKEVITTTPTITAKSGDRTLAGLILRGLRDNRLGQKPTCYECGAQGHFKRDCPKLKNNNRDNQGGNGLAPAKVYAVGRAGTNPDSNIVTGTFLLNNRYSSVLFDTGADRSFVSTTFSS